MSKIKEIIEGLQILAEYDDDVSAEHDTIFAGPSEPKLVNVPDRKRLRKLDWFIDEDADSWARFL